MTAKLSDTSSDLQRTTIKSPTTNNNCRQAHNNNISNNNNTLNNNNNIINKKINITTGSKSSSVQTSLLCRDTRRANKPLMEKRRRARINQSLAVLKSLILDSAKMENTKHSKLEKADILELTVRHLQRQRTLSTHTVDKYKAGFLECAREVSRFLDTPELYSGCKTGNAGSAGALLLESSVRQRLVRHLESCAAEIELDFSPAAVGQVRALDDEAERRLDQLEELLGGEVPDSSSGGGGSLTGGSPAGTGPADLGKPRMGKQSGVVHALAKPPGTGGPQPDSSTAEAAVQQPNVSVQVIPSRLPDGQVVFLLPSHYVAMSGGVEPEGECLSRLQEGEVHCQGEIKPHHDEIQPLDFSVRTTATTTDQSDPVWRPW